MDSTTAAPVLELKDVSKSFGAVIALRRADLALRAGSIHAVVGENGAGKSTLVKIMAGLYQRDTGTFEMDGAPVHFRSTAEAKAAGIAVIYQEPTLFPDLSVTENVFMGRQPVGRFGRIDKAAMRAEVVELMNRLGVRIDPDRLTDGLSIADQQIIEIAKAISLDARVLIMDEPTAALSGVEVERLFAVARSLRDEGRALMFISHRFDEVFGLCDTVTVMRDGTYISTEAIADTSEAEIVRLMVGREVKELFPKVPAEIGRPLLQVDGLTMAGTFADISFTVRSGEIVALAGLVGAGRSEVARAVFGVDPYEAGQVRLDGVALPKQNPAASMRAGLALVPEDRRKQGLVIDATVATNITDAIRPTLTKFGLITARRENHEAQLWARKLEVKTAALDAVAGTLSGGNQQKVVLAKWLAANPKVLIIDEPTRGIDVGTKSEVHRMMSELAGMGLAILMISSELPEVLGMADRVLVMHEGRITADIPRAEATPETVMFAATHTNEEVA
ncbi:sugar ABC transporter ATP-binding protein [Propionicimonas sp.]|uniref:sugar ABC transporter ATP-binding protein n=1 Tax=Propionicimonas sp. TaxID=1955623 RepID=UPI0039E580D4